MKRNRMTLSPGRPVYGVPGTSVATEFSPKIAKLQGKMVQWRHTISPSRSRRWQLMREGSDDRAIGLRRRKFQSIDAKRKNAANSVSKE